MNETTNGNHQSGFWHSRRVCVMRQHGAGFLGSFVVDKLRRHGAKGYNGFAPPRRLRPAGACGHAVAWDTLFKKTQQQLVAAARRAR